MFNPTTLDMIEVVKFFVELLKPDNYLELGIYKGETISHVSQYVQKQCIGVDIIAPEKSECYTFYQMTTNEFFKTKVDLPQFDIVFIDADHSYIQSLLDFNNVFGHVAEQGLIFMHDTFPKNEEYTLPGYCGDTYKTAIFLQHRRDCEIVTLPIHPGITIVRKRSNHLSW